MKSCIYSCDLVHDRRKPKKHRFAYRTMLFSIDLDEIEHLDSSLFLFSANRRNAYSLNDSDHVREHRPSLKENVIKIARDFGVNQEIGRIILLTNLRTWGHIFNPVSFYIIEDANENPLLGLAEVANTFNEMKLYPIRGVARDGTLLHEMHVKNFYISPYSPLDTDINFRIEVPGDTLSLSVTEQLDGEFYFASTVKGKRIELTNAALAWSCIAFPLATVAIVARIHFQALKLWIKGIPFFRKKDKPHLQTETRVYLESEKPKPATTH